MRGRIDLIKIGLNKCGKDPPETLIAFGWKGEEAHEARRIMEVVERSKIDKRKYATDGRPTSELYPNVPITGFGSWICLLLFVHPVYVLTHTRFLPREAERRDTRGARSRTDRIGREPSHVIDSG